MKTYFRVVEVCKCASTKLCVSSPTANSGSDAEAYAAVGASDGFVNVVRLKTFSVHTRSGCHDFPVTGIMFQPTAASSSGKQKFPPEIKLLCLLIQCIIVLLDPAPHLLSCSADYALAATKVLGIVPSLFPPFLFFTLLGP